MKKDIHPQIFEEVTVTCACGNSFVTQSTVGTIAVDICSKCHPLYTGKQKFIDTEGRIDKFNKRKEIANQKTKTTKETSKKSDPAEQKSLKEMLQDTQK